MKPKAGASERLRNSAQATLHRALDEHLPSFDRCDLLHLRRTLPAAEWFQSAVGTIAPRDHWRRARLRVDEELARREGPAQ